jgi:hypothetical protein
MSELSVAGRVICFAPPVLSVWLEFPYLKLYTTSISHLDGLELYRMATIWPISRCEEYFFVIQTYHKCISLEIHERNWSS